MLDLWPIHDQISFLSNLWPFMTFSRMNTRITSLFLIYDHWTHPVINIEWYKWCVCSLYGALGVYKPVYISIETFYIDLLTILCFKQSFKKYFRIDISIIQFHPDKTKKNLFYPAGWNTVITWLHPADETSRFYPANPEYNLMYTCAELQPELVDMWPFANKSDVHKPLMVYLSFCCFQVSPW